MRAMAEAVQVPTSAWNGTTPTCFLKLFQKVCHGDSNRHPNTSPDTGNREELSPLNAAVPQRAGRVTRMAGPRRGGA